jgi:hypothetical protein
VKLLVEWGRSAFIVSAASLLVLARLDARGIVHLPTPLIVLGSTTIATLPFAIVAVWREGDPASRRYWLLFFGLCLLLVILVFVWH